MVIHRLFKRFLSISFFLIISLFPIWEVPTNITYQGFLSIGGLPYEGNTNISFEILDSTLTVIWDDLDVLIAVRAGVYNHELRVPVNFLHPTNRCILRISVAGSVITPDIALASVPYAYYAHSVAWSNILDMPLGFADGYDADGSPIWNTSGPGIFYSSGSVGIGVSPPSSGLAVRGNISLIDNEAVFSLYDTPGWSKCVIGNSDTNNDMVSLFINGYDGDASGNYAVLTHFGSVSNNYRFAIRNTWGPITLQEAGGNVGIGTVSPWLKLMISGGEVGIADGGSSNNAIHDGIRLWTDNSPYYAAIRPYRGALSRFTGLSFFTSDDEDPPTEKLRIAPNGKVGIGTVGDATAPLHVRTTLPGNALVVEGTGGNFYNSIAYFKPYNVQAWGPELRIYATTNTDVGVMCLNTVRSAIAPGGVLSLQSYNANGYVAIGGLGVEGYKLRVWGGSAAVDAGQSWTTSSDMRLKKNISDLGGTLDKVASLRGVTYHTLDEDQDASKHIGFIAQEIEAQFPEVVITGDNGYKGIDYGRMNAILLEAIKELNRKVSDQQLEIDRLKAERD